jgi:hypothetical protein
MYMNIAVLIFVLSIGYAWMIRGVFNALIHLLCALAAGAIAFAVWEPLALMLIEMSPERGFLSLLEKVAWGVSLVVPFVVIFIILRTLTDKLISNNIRNSPVIDYIGGGACGLATGIICAGILVIGIGTMRVPTNFLGYQPMGYSDDRTTGGGSIVRGDKLWIPVDTITAKIYNTLSIGTMSSNEPLAKWYPELELVGITSRISPSNGSGRNAISPDDFKIKATYFVGDPKATLPVNELLKDLTNDRTQKYVDVENEPVSKGYLAGYVVEFEPGAKERGEKGGQLVVSNGQYRLLISDDDGNTNSVFPVAVISESSEPDQYGRWRFDTPDVFITSVGGKSRVLMAFEYVIPEGFTPVAFQAKNIRVLTDTFPEPIKFAMPIQRDLLVRSGSLLRGESFTKRVLDTTNTITYDPTKRPSSGFSLIQKTIKVGEMMSTQVARRGFTIDEKNLVVDGEGEWLVKTEVGRKNAPMGKSLRVEKYAVAPGQSLIRVNVGPESVFGLLSDPAREAPLDQPILLIDESGNEYEAIGFEYTDSEIFHARLTRGSTVNGIQDVPSITRSRSDQKLQLLFVVTRGVKITHFVIGDVAIAEFSPPVETN